MRQVAARLTSPESPNLNLDPIERMTMLNRHIMQFMHRSYPKIADSITALEKAIRETPVVIGIGYHLNPFVEDIPYRAHAIRLMWNDAGVDICLMEPKLFSTRSRRQQPLQHTRRVAAPHRSEALRRRADARSLPIFLPPSRATDSGNAPSQHIMSGAKPTHFQGSHS